MMNKRQVLPFDIPTDWSQPATPVYRSVDEVARRLKPEGPVQCVFPEAVRGQARRFLDAFPGQVLYAVKCNPNQDLLRHMYAAGIRHFDVASLEEARLVAGLFPDAALHFMHPVKSREAIRAAYKLGVRTFALDSTSELMKILEETRSAKNLNLFVRLAVGASSAAYDLSGKFGAAPSVAAELLRHARKVAHRIGLCFHVGSQCMSPESYRSAIARAIEVVGKAKVKLDVLDVGGGFPAAYPGMTPPPLDQFFAAITETANPLVEAGTELWCEPGRAMVAAGAAMLVRVTLRKGRRLYINDGTYGSLFDAGALGWRYPVRLVRPRARVLKDAAAKDGAETAKDAPREGLGKGLSVVPPSDKLVPFVFYGPTCDTMDKMKGPFLLPEDTQEGDWIEVSMLGAYGAAMQTRFNGFHAERVATVWPEAGAVGQLRPRRRPVAEEARSLPSAAPLLMTAPKEAVLPSLELHADGPDSGVE
jgi:ornithine decarboxylase